MTSPFRPFFVEPEHAKSDAIVRCPQRKKDHEVQTLMEALENGWLLLPDEAGDDVDQVGISLDPRELVINEINWLRRTGDPAEAKLRQVS